MNSSLTCRSAKESTGVSNRVEAEKSDEVQNARLARRGATHAFQQLSEQFGVKLLDTIPTMWQSMAGGLLSACHSSTWNSWNHSGDIFTRS